MVRSRIGPLAIEAPLGSKDSSLYRAVHLKQHNRVAVRLLPLALGLTAAAKQQFSDELERFKALQHPHIVRCYGGGFDDKHAYFVYDLIDAQSLDKRLDLNDPNTSQRLPWELVLQYGLQICDAMQYAHNEGCLHLNFTSRQVLCLEDGQSIKLAGFRGAASEQLSKQTPSLLELAHRSPEQFATQYTRHPAIDLYAIGVVFYAALTGQLPYTGKTAEELQHNICKSDAPSVATIVFDCPVWMSRIVDQLLSKDPVKRPFTSAAVSLALLEAQKHAISGATLAEQAIGGFSPLQLGLNKDEAERALGLKPKKKRSKKDSDQPLMERPWVLVTCLVVVLAAGAYLMRPLSEDTLKARAERLIATGDRVNYIDARDRFLDKMLTQYPNGKHSQWAQEQWDFIEMINAEVRMTNHLRFNQDPESEGERKYSEANRYERFGDRVTALERYKAIVELYKDTLAERPFVNLSRRQIQQIEAEEPDQAELQKFLTAKLDAADQLLKSGDVVGAKRIWDSVINLYNGNAEMITVVSRAQSRLDTMKQ